ncbi:hypothetical protein AJ79_05210 [Helicocarpus griseus UAMH5409]|uniref:Uncharacterized protein n=1 Tax=Helicocarpus griseus UAMH5409 TaxID=1447875 RepID=A0A2B7XPH4_9EURO|nr:hypothetical protein AJ79_05210 [Helicocarpus griseus UAMH5409]
MHRQAVHEHHDFDNTVPNPVMPADPDGDRVQAVPDGLSDRVRIKHDLCDADFVSFVGVLNGPLDNGV